MRRLPRGVDRPGRPDGRADQDEARIAEPAAGIARQSEPDGRPVEKVFEGAQHGWYGFLLAGSCEFFQE